MNLSRKYVASKIRQFEKEGLLINENNEWNMTQKGKIVVGVDESGSEY
jgi:predicted transcriptional regulator